MENNSFNKRVLELLQEAPTTNYAKFIIQLREKFQSNDFHRIIDDNFIEQLKIELVYSMKHTSNGKIKGYIPGIYFKENNFLNKTVHVEYFDYANKPISINKCKIILAEEIIYVLARVDNLFDLVK